MIKIEAQQRLQQAAKSKPLKVDIAKIKANVDALERSFYNITGWYQHIKKNPAKALKTLVDIFGYKPYDKAVYRAFPLKITQASKVVEGGVYKLKTGKSPIQSWTTTVPAAVRFLTEENPHATNYCVCKLISPGLELSNREWLVSVTSAILAIKPAAGDDTYLVLKGIAGGVLDLIEHFDYEDEVIMQLPEISKVQLKLLINRKAKNRSSTRHDAALEFGDID